VKRAEGAIDDSAPQIADRAEPFRSRIREIVGSRTESLEALAVEMYARGLSTRDIEPLFADDAGKLLLSRTAVSEVTERLWAEYEAFASRDLAEFKSRTCSSTGSPSGCIWAGRGTPCPIRSWS
jgi:transposase-like protein